MTQHSRVTSRAVAAAARWTVERDELEGICSNRPSGHVSFESSLHNSYLPTVHSL